jgi:hypothetical protein
VCCHCHICCPQTLQSHFKVLACSYVYAGYLLALLLSMLLVPTPILLQLLLLLLLLLDAGLRCR